MIYKNRSSKKVVTELPESVYTPIKENIIENSNSKKSKTEEMQSWEKEFNN